MADNEIVVEVKAKLDDIEKKLAGLEKKSKDTGNTIAENLSNGIKEFTGVSVAQFAAAGAAIGAAAVVMKKALDFALEGEALKNLDIQFNFLAESAGIAGERLKEALKSKAAGLVDDSDIIKSASRGIVTLGESAKRLPETFELARRATALFGGEVTENFELINAAVASGNVRSLRAIGIVIDHEKAYKKFAGTIGATIGSLTEAGHKQAILNAVLETGQRNYAGIDPEINKTHNSTQRLHVQITELKETFLKLVATTTGGFFQTVADGFTKIAVAANHALQRIGGTEKLPISEQIDLLKKDLAEAEKATVSFKRGFDGALEAQSPEANRAIAEGLKAKLANLEAIQSAQREEAAKAGPTGNADDGAQAGGSPLFKKELVDTQHAQILAKIRETNLATVQLQTEGFTEQEINLAVQNEQRLTNQAQTDLQIAAVKQQARDADVASQVLYEAQIKAIREKGKAEDDALQQKSLQTIKITGDQFRKLAANGIAGGIQVIVTALATGKNGFAAFAKFILNLLGDLAIQIGTMAIVTGITYKSLQLFEGSQAIAYGAALVALGALLKAFSGGGGDAASGGAAPTPSFGGADAGLAGGGTGSQFTDQDAARAKGTQVTVNVQGNVLDRRESGLAIAEVIQQHFDNNGSVISKAGIV